MQKPELVSRKKAHILGWRGVILMLSVSLLFTTVCRKKMEQAKNHFDQGVQYEAQEKVEEAIREFKQAIQLQPDYADAHFHLGGLYQIVKAFSSAIEEYEKVLRIQPSYPKIHTAFANLYYERGLRAWGRAIKFDWSTFLHPDTLRQLPFTDKAGLLKLIEEYQNKLNTDTADAETFSKLSQAYFIMAVEEYQKAILANPSDTAAQFYLGLTYSEQGYPQRAMAQYEILKKLDSRAGEQLLAMLKQKEKENQELEKLKKRKQQ
jgi:tetratricopeptide (TPR) repeat protein